MIILQDNPQRMPNVLTPSLDIQDIDHLKLDIQKWITEKSFIEWEDFLQNQIPQMQEPPVQPNKWNLDIVKEVIASREAQATEASIATAADSLILEKERVDCEVSVSLHDAGEASHIALTTIHVLHVHTTCLPG